MTTHLPPASCRAFALGLCALALANCGTAAPSAPTATPAAAPAASAVAPSAKPAAPSEPVFAAPASAKPAMVASLVASAPAKIVADLDALSRRLDLPMMLGKEVRSALGGMGLLGDEARFSAVWERLDPATPFAAVWVLPPKSEVKGFCAALTFRDGQGARRTFEEMGTPGAQRSGLSERKTPGGDILWGGVRGRTLFLSGSPEALLLAGGLAEAAQATLPAGQIAVTVLPPAIVVASGKSREALVADLLAGMTKEITSTPGLATPASRRFVTALMAGAVKVVFDATEIRLLLDLGPDDGLLLQTEIFPAPGTSLAARAAARAPYVFDTRLPVRDDGTAALAFGSLSGSVSLLAKPFAASGPAGQGLARAMEKYFSATREWSCVVEPAEAGFASLCSSPLRPGVTPKAALDGAAALMEAQQAWEGELYGKKLGPLKIKRSRDVIEIDKKFEQPDPQARAMAKAFAGGESLKTVCRVKNGRLLQATGRDAKKTLARYGAEGSLKGAPLVSAALTRAKGSEGVLSVDVISMALKMLGQGKDLPGNPLAMVAAALPGVPELRAPFWFVVRGGNTLAGDFRIPLGSLEKVAKVVRGMLSTAGAKP
ncbi:MAG: hypothetical protein JXP73_02665 [Deltaproteobacteria bacterium]|nr:hypothetical protein [Deltaproteobacteria bacterium]